LASSVAVVALIARSFSLYHESRGVQYGANTADYRLEPTGSTSVWLQDIVMTPSDILLAFASSGALWSVALIVFDLLNLQTHLFYRTMIMLGGFWVMLWATATLAFAVGSATVGDSLGNYACANSDSILDVMAHFSGVCHAQVSNSGPINRSSSR
jgi:hypothetical protein